MLQPDPARAAESAPPSRSTEAIRALFSQHGVRDVECIFPDISGYPRGKLMPAERFLAGEELRICQAIPMQAVTGDYSYNPVFPDSDPDVRLLPDYATVALAPWANVPRAVAIHDCLELDGSLCQFAPRSTLKGVLARYAALGLRPVVAPEIEFYLTAPNADPAQPLQAPLVRGGRAEVGQSAFSLNMLNELAPFWNELRDACRTLGIATDTWIHEVGATQYEVNLLHGDAMAVADQAFLFKYAAREIALKHGLNAVFMAKPIAGSAGNSMHLHISVIDTEGNNVFSLADGSESPHLGHFIAGLQTFLPELMLMLAPNVNSYRRYVAGSQAPVNLQWGYDNRTTGLRIPASGPSARRVENRLAGADANPYLAMAASLAAGLEGLQAQLASSEPLAGNGYDSAHSLPRSMEESVQAMQHSAFARTQFGDPFVTGYCAVKALEWASFQREISVWERRFLLPQV
ncbi:glutamine synthetase family protein [Rhodoferax sp.]|uniref:glutamine synthetase family protein n=1 Tax=Rhodoferax sp. TaxID=50421 RepID=UPI002730928C|nr:glutamine synthetase family protein [Rhodoferax sp.]MDP1530618.1 glutamine synthetase family protein [Rhodoferax sp.]MDP1944681.1 glutamine synthetase family protein [Rhodoferax sp.]MDP2443553.1 glutamine synthetase family protein [Rhodoferax sp.]MDZ4208291.1 glutamine synthetase family protein [Rhodoferax sp.]